MPATKPFRSATCASTLLAWMHIGPLALGREPLGQVRAEELADASECRRSAPPRRCSRAGSMPSTGIPALRDSTAAGSRRCWRSRRPGCRARALAPRSAARRALRRGAASCPRTTRSRGSRGTAAPAATVSVICTSVQSGQKTRSSGKRRLRLVAALASSAARWPAASARATGSAPDGAAARSARRGDARGSCQRLAAR